MEEIVQEVHFHGIWKAGFKVSDKLMKSIGEDILTKPYRVCNLVLTSAGLTLDILSNEGKTRKTDKIPFDFLRNISVNQYQSKCLVVVYIDSMNKFSVMAFSSESEDFANICEKYKDQKNFLFQNLQTTSQSQMSQNWMLTPKQQTTQSNMRARLVSESYLKSSTRSEVAHQHGGVPTVAVVRRQRIAAFPKSNQRYSYPQTSGSKRDEFLDSRWVLVHEHEILAREQAEKSLHSEAETFHVGIQTPPFEDDSDLDSITSAMSLQSTRNGEDPDPEVGNHQGEKSKGISADVYYKRTDKHGHGTTDDNHNGSSNINGHPRHEISHHDVKLTNGHETVTGHTLDEPSYDLRSVATQTINGSKSVGRYTKNLSRTYSNSYRDKAEAQKKKSTIAGPKSPTAHGPDALVRPIGSYTSSRHNYVASTSQRNPAAHGPDAHVRPIGSSTSSRHNSVTSTSQRSSVGSSHPGAHVVKRTSSIASSTNVIKPIENVYLGRSARRANSARIYRPIIVYAPVPQHRLL